MLPAGEWKQSQFMGTARRFPGGGSGAVTQTAVFPGWDVSLKEK